MRRSTCTLLLLFCLLSCWPVPVRIQARAAHWHIFPSALRVTQYTDCCVTASGRRVFYGEAAGPPWMPFGTKVRVPGLGTFVILDRGGLVQGCCHIDIWVPRFPLPGVRDWYSGATWLS